MEPEEVLAVLRNSVAGCVDKARKVAVAYSGGLDSSLLARLGSEVAEIVCYSAAIGGSHDARFVSRHGESDGFAVKLIVIEDSELPRMMSLASRIMGTEDPMRIAYSIPTVVVIDRCSENLVLAGNGADELFAGYAKYSLRRNEASRMMEEDLNKSLEEARFLSSYALSRGRRLRLPFLADDVVTLARKISLDQKLAGDERKGVLREVGRLVGLAGAERPKKAAQYSSGTLGAMRRLAKREGLSVSEWTRRTASDHHLGKD